MLRIGRFAIGVMLLCFVCGEAVSAADVDGTFLGYSPINCLEYSADYGLSDLREVEGGYEYKDGFDRSLNYVLGFITGVNFEAVGNDDVFKMKPVGVAAWLASWCRDNPAKDLLAGLVHLRHKRLRIQ